MVGQHHANDKLKVGVWAKPLSCRLNQITIDERSRGEERGDGSDTVYVY